jgi:hypothetical protein
MGHMRVAILVAGLLAPMTAGAPIRAYVPSDYTGTVSVLDATTDTVRVGEGRADERLHAAVPDRGVLLRPVSTRL